MVYAHNNMIPCVLHILNTVTLMKIQRKHKAMQGHGYVAHMALMSVHTYVGICQWPLITHYHIKSLTNVKALCGNLPECRSIFVLIKWDATMLSLTIYSQVHK